jgi:hypothetical protein
MVPPMGKNMLITSIVQAILYGMYMMTVVHSLRWLLYEDRGWKLQAVHWPMSIVTVLLFIFSTVDLGITLQIAFAVFAGENLVAKKLEVLGVRIST